MSRTSYVELTTEEADLYFKGLQSGDRLTFSKMSRKVTLMSRKRKKGISQRSLLPLMSELWAGLSDYEKANWKDAAIQCGLKNFQLFVQDTAARIYNDIPGLATPNLLHQSWVGYLSVQSPATEIKITQLHPRNYYVYSKVIGFKNMYEPVLVTEDFALPLQVSINYKSDLELISPIAALFGDCYFGYCEFGDESGIYESELKFYAEVWSSYQGLDIKTNVECNLDAVADWKNATATLTSVIGYVVGYNLYIFIKGYRGILYCDNIKATHSSQNWVRDTYCKDINQGFTKAFAQIPKNWVAVSIPAGAEFETIYPPDE